MYPKFATALQELGKTNQQRGAALEVSYKTVTRYLDGDLPEPLLKLLRHPHLLYALAEDAKSLQQDDNIATLTS